MKRERLKAHVLYNNKLRNPPLELISSRIPPGPFRYWCFYVKNLGGQAHNRIEESHQVNQPPGLLESILNPYASLEKKIDLLETKLDSLISINKV